MERATVDSVPVFWREGPPPFRAGLVFGVGRRDESFVKGGITHLVEHLTMGAIGRTTLDCNASVDVHTTAFVAAGRTEPVAEFLQRVCEIVADLPTERLNVEADVLKAEGAGDAQPLVAQLLGEVYGGYGVGLAAYREPALLAITADDVREWSRHYFTRANAAVWLTGPVPPGLTLPLPDGDTPVRQAQRRRKLATPGWSQHPVEGLVGVGAHVPHTPALGAACRVLRERLEDELRHRRGVSYLVDVDNVPIDTTDRFVALFADVREGQETTAAATLWAALSALAAAGPTDAELDHDHQGAAEYFGDPRSIEGDVTAAASAQVTGMPFHSREQLRAEAAALTAEDVRAAAADLRSKAIIGVPEPVELEIRGIKQLPEWSPNLVTGRSFRRRLFSSAPWRSRLVLGSDGVSLVLRGKEQVTVRYSDVIGLVEVGRGEYELVGVDNLTIPLLRRDWHGGADVLAAVRAALPAELQVRADPEDVDDVAGPTVLLLRAPEHLAREALWPIGRDVWLRSGPEWSMVAPAGDHWDHSSEIAAQLSGYLGKRRPVLMISKRYDELSAALLRGGREFNKHVWTAGPQLHGSEDSDPDGVPSAATVLAEAVGRPEAASEIAALLAMQAQPPIVLEQVVRVLELPPQVHPLLAGESPAALSMEHVPARGFVGGMRASMRGEFDAPDEGGWGQRLLAWHARRPGSYRLLNALLVVPQATLAWWFAREADGDWTSWWAVLSVVAALGAVSSLWDTRPAPRARHD